MTNIEKLEAIRTISEPLHEALVIGAKISILDRRRENPEECITDEKVADMVIEWLAANLPHITKLREII